MSAYTEAVQHYLSGLETVSPTECPGCEACYGWCNTPEEPTEEQRAVAEEPSFSCQPCDACGSSPGDRHPAHGIDQASGDVLHLDICIDCVLYLANGDEPESW